MFAVLADELLEKLNNLGKLFTAINGRITNLTSYAVETSHNRF